MAIFGILRGVFREVGVAGRGVVRNFGLEGVSVQNFSQPGGEWGQAQTVLELFNLIQFNEK